MTDAEPDDQPLFTVVKGSPTDEELAALIVVFSSARTNSGSAGAARSSGLVVLLAIGAATLPARA